MESASIDDLKTSEAPVLPGYVAKRLLGSGAFGEVWLAQDMCGLFYAVKVIYRNNPVYPNAEALEFKGLRHYLGISRENENLVQIYFIGTGLDHRFFYYVMDLADDANGRDRIRVAQYVPRTLAYEIRHRGSLPSAQQVVRLGQSLLRGLSYLHEKHLVHRDIKPSNIVFCRGEPKLSDFGLVCIPSKLDRAERIGTPYYAPEKGKGTHGADLFSLGKVLWVYWTGCDVAEFPCIPHGLLEGSPEAASNRLNEVLNHACEEEPAERYQGWAEMWAELAAIDRSAAGAQAPTPALPQPEPTLSLPPAPVSVINRNSRSYIRREADKRLSAELLTCQKQGGLIRVKGARQSGKTSLIARALEEAREAGFQVIMADLRQLNMSDLKELEGFYRAFAQLVSASVGAEKFEYDSEVYYSANQRLTDFMEREVFTRLPGPVLLAMDNVERLIRQPYSADVYSLIRSWYEFRETRDVPWRRFTLLLAYSDDELILEQEMRDQSPFNVGIRIEVGDLSLANIGELNSAYHSPLGGEQECSRFYRLTGGQPFLANLGLYALAHGKMDLDEFEATADRESGPYRDQLRQVRRRVERIDPGRKSIAAVLQRKGCPDEQTFLNLQSLGILTGSQREPRFSCEIYARFFSHVMNPTQA